MITVENVTKTFGGTRALTNVSLTAKPGRITGFLGPNGAGKSTAMRIICGLARPDSGTALVEGVPYAHLPNPARRVGALLDASAHHDGRTGLETLTLAAIALGIPRTRVTEVIALVGLTPKEARRRVGTYSLGMRQRLGIATALLPDPRILILDEPVNGLDPSGIRWMRDLLRHFADDGGTVLLSSHLLMEIEAVADDIIVIGNGQIVAQGAKEDLLRGSSTSVSALSIDPLRSALLTAGHTADTVGPHSVTTSADPETVGRLALDHQIVLTGLHQQSSGTLEDLFFSLTSNHDRTVTPQGAPS
ncbi:ABC transporter ATP-binding protein [Jonesia denitrificans]|uniref:ABC transporter related n=1 Tax=Jonesia denitrificans (strain ATCC 14870 / DSM 20603 / BCRC 15368 / CIP 55.134 / JCM 11481 / NBRC 15587 / NCTC 10816 / Prevot 55134) TaxID=471856 RepID=C7R396_JONDD|nr:ATP-binding cassette domain-containing protein [Jonesia denitrificans]ACV10144.1 ABC transporter related [Jonesia denitrificans DSM 20603]QXB43239.1 ATP-binding cassette domain-containing protein [Jonesia denitrificans]SQH23048.1 Daunorubicin/doxorubicin resistance ATP-binding protein DrrA [Jonesia denitrificans]